MPMSQISGTWSTLSMGKLLLRLPRSKGRAEGHSEVDLVQGGRQMAEDHLQDQELLEDDIARVLARDVVGHALQEDIGNLEKGL